MRLQDLAQLSTRMFKTNPLRTWLTILGMGVGTGAVVVLVGLGFGLQQIILEQIVFGETLLSLGVSATGALTPGSEAKTTQLVWPPSRACFSAPSTGCRGQSPASPVTT